jgi:hypothetical protein
MIVIYVLPGRSTQYFLIVDTEQCATNVQHLQCSIDQRTIRLQNVRIAESRLKR